jgi:hypothetical protein
MTCEDPFQGCQTSSVLVQLTSAALFSSFQKAFQRLRTVNSSYGPAGQSSELSAALSRCLFELMTLVENNESFSEITPFDQNKKIASVEPSRAGSIPTK